MDQFARYAFFTVARDTGFVALAAVTLMVGFSFDPALALDIAAHIALLFSVLLIVRARWLTEHRFTRCEPWRGLEPCERPAGDTGLRWARDQMEFLLLRFAKGASGAACALYGFSLIASSG